MAIVAPRTEMKMNPVSYAEAANIPLHIYLGVTSIQLSGACCLDGSDMLIVHACSLYIYLE